MRVMRTMRAMRVTRAAALAAISFTSTAAFAQSRDPAAAEAAFSEGQSLMKQGRFEEACRKLEASHALDPATGTLLNLGACYEKTGKTASAWLRYREAAASALAKGQREREEIARARVNALEPQL